MGHGYSTIALPAGPSALENSELTDLTFEKPLGRGRFLRTVRARHPHGVVVAKVCMKGNATISYQTYARLLREDRTRLKSVPNALAYQRIRETSTLGILVRQYIHTSLYDRISIRPFLEDIERKWIAFQLLCAVRDCHAQNVFHGDIKPENVMVTSWGWVYLTDFASTFKPVYLPDNNPADFYYYFDSSERGVCYLAPERFVAANEQPSERDVVQWNMDVFSLGCVLAELFTETATFNLERLFKYRRGEYDPTLLLLDKVDDIHIRSLIGSMLRLDPADRWLASDYLDEYKGKAFPLYFYNHFHTLMQEITDPTLGNKPVTTSDANNGEADDRIDRIYNDFDLASVSLGYDDVERAEDVNVTAPSLTEFFPLQLDLPNNRHAARSATIKSAESGTLILLNVITSSLRSSARAASKIRACELLLAFAEHLPDEAKLDRVLPYVLPLLDDPNAMVLVAALRTMTQLLALVKVVAPVNSFLFTQYIFPRLQSFVKGKAFREYPLVRATYAACLASLAETASRFLDMMQALRAGGSLGATGKTVDADGDGYAAYYDAHDSTRVEMLDQFEAQTKVFLTDTDNAVRRSFLTSVSSLCVFLGEARASDVILSHLNTYLNDPDWLLKCAFFRTIVGVAVYIGGANLEEYLLPLMQQALADPQEFVVEQALRSLAGMAEMGLLQRAKTWELIDTVARFQLHPNLWIKEAAAHFISAATGYLSMADVRILVAPLIQPYVKVPVNTLDESEILDALKKPLPRSVLDLALQWAANVDKGLFWKPAKDTRHATHRTIGQMPPRSSVAELGPRALAKLPKTVEDEQWLGRLRNAGMRPEDEIKLLAFREYLWRSAQRSKRDESLFSDALYDQIISLTKLKINPQTVIFDNDVQLYERHAQRQDHTIAEALQEASNPEATKRLSLARPPAGENDNEVRKIDIPIRPSRLSELRGRGSASPSPSPTSRNGILAMKDVDPDLRPRSSAAALISGIDLRNKAAAEVATDAATAAGRLDSTASGSGKVSPSPSSIDRRPTASRNASHKAVHNYLGNDPTVLKLLDTVYVDSFPVDAAEFGPMIQPISGPIPATSGQPGTAPWHPNGQLIATLGEHSAKVTRVLPAPDHTFFLTASDDGTIKVWDTARLERNVNNNSRQTFRLGAKIKATSICFIDSTYSFICTGDDGSVRVVKVDVGESSGSTRYGKLRTLREWTIPTFSPTGEYAVWTEHFRGDGASTLVLATNLGRILALDLRHMSILFELRNPASHGAPTCFCVSRRHDWLLVGTTHGVLDLWDLRFQLRLRSWAFPAACPITRLQLHPSHRSSRRYWVCVCGGTSRGEATVWDIEKVICHEVYRPSWNPSSSSSSSFTPSDATNTTSSPSTAPPRLHIRDYELRNLDDEKPETLLSRLSSQFSPSSSSPDSSMPHSPPTTSSVFAVQSTTTNPQSQHVFAITGGPDSRVRFWACERLEGCRVVSGGEPGAQPPTYAYGQLGLDTRVVVEGEAAKEKVAEKGSEGEGGSTQGRQARKGRDGAGKGVSSAGARYDAIRLGARFLIGGHLDVITDVAVLQRPVGMVVSADRSGTVFVYS